MQEKFSHSDNFLADSCPARSSKTPFSSAKGLARGWGNPIHSQDIIEVSKAIG